MIPAALFFSPCFAAVLSGLDAAKGIGILILTLALVRLSLEDIKTLELSDRNLAGLCLLALASLAFPGAIWEDRVLGAVLFSVPMAFFKLLNRNAFGSGDIALAFFLGLLLGAAGSALAGLLALLSGGVFSLYLLLKGRRYMPFAPFLSLGAYLALLFGDGIIRCYSRFCGN